MAAQSREIATIAVAPIVAAQSALRSRQMGELLLRQSWLQGGCWTSLGISKHQLLKGSPLKKLPGQPSDSCFRRPLRGRWGISNFLLLIQPRIADSRCVHCQDIAHNTRVSNSLAVVEV